jgi:hypothetical protein
MERLFDWGPTVLASICLGIVGNLLTPLALKLGQSLSQSCRAYLVGRLVRRIETYARIDSEGRLMFLAARHGTFVFLGVTAMLVALLTVLITSAVATLSLPAEVRFSGFWEEFQKAPARHSIGFVLFTASTYAYQAFWGFHMFAMLDVLRYGRAPSWFVQVAHVRISALGDAKLREELNARLVRAVSYLHSGRDSTARDGLVNCEHGSSGQSRV